MLSNEKKFELVKLAQSRCYAIYSKFHVGAMVIFNDDSYVLGCNVENGSYGLTVCAERIAIFNSIASGKNMKDAVELVCIGETSQPTAPCGACREVMNEFFSNEFIVTLFNNNGDMKQFKLGELLPYGFEKDELPNV